MPRFWEGPSNRASDGMRRMGQFKVLWELSTFSGLRTEGAFLEMEKETISRIRYRSINRF